MDSNDQQKKRYRLTDPERNALMGVQMRLQAAVQKITEPYLEQQNAVIALIGAQQGFSGGVRLSNDGLFLEEQ